MSALVCLGIIVFGIFTFFIVHSFLALEEEIEFREKWITPARKTEWEMLKIEEYWSNMSWETQEYLILNESDLWFTMGRLIAYRQARRQLDNEV